MAQTPGAIGNLIKSEGSKGSRPTVLLICTAPTTRNSCPVQRQRAKCFICGLGHKLVDCRRFQYMHVNERWNVIKQGRICANCCSQTNHESRTCYLPPQCRENNCHKKHHTLLHNFRPNTHTVERLNVHNHKQCLFQILPITLKHNAKQLNTFAFIDTGSSASLILKQTKEALKATGPKLPLSLSWTSRGARQ